MTGIYSKLDKLGDEGMSAIWAVPVLAGLKPIGTCGSTDVNVAQGLERLLRRAGLSVRRHLNRHRSHVLAFGRDAGNLSDILRAFSVGNERRQGELLGYPSTAVDGFVKEDLLPYAAEPLEMNVAWALQFRLSRTHWRDEVAILRTWNETAKGHLPNLFKRCVDHVRTIEFRSPT